MSVFEHRREAPSFVTCSIITVSDTRTKETDRSGQLILQLLTEQGHSVDQYHIVKDDYNHIQAILKELHHAGTTETVLLNGGTGIALKDTTFEAVRDLLDKQMDGFGEIFRYLSYTEDIGTAAILSRAVAGVYGNMAVFSMPGSTGAVKLAMNRIILPELGHVMREIYKDRK